MGSPYQFLLVQDTKSEDYQIWQFDVEGRNPFAKIPVKKGSSIPKGSKLIQVGNYILQWGALNSDGQYPYRLLQFNPGSDTPLGSYTSAGAWTESAVQSGTWSKGKFFGSRPDFANPDGAQKEFASGSTLVLIPFDNFVLNWIPTDGRGTYQLFNFDPQILSTSKVDPISVPMTPQGAWLTIQAGHELHSISGFAIDRVRSTGDIAIWQFDAQCFDPFRYKPVIRTNWKKLGITAKHELVVIGDLLMDWLPSTNKYRIRRFDHTYEDGVSEVIREGSLPKQFTKTSVITTVETLVPVDDAKSKVPGTIDYMRSNIQHVVYYMLENRSFDHVLGWLHDKKAKINVVGPDGPFKGVDPSFKNTYQGKEYAITQYNNGKLSSKTKDGQPFTLDLDSVDPYHDNSDVLRQMFSKDINDYLNKKTPDMGGFAWNNGTPEVMLGYSPEQLPVLNGLASNFAVSDEWFCSIPSGTDVNRAFAFAGSSLGQLNNFQNGVQYSEWSSTPHRPSIWKVLWSNGISDWKIYNSVEWMSCKFTYNLFLEGQIPSVDGSFGGVAVQTMCPQLNQFYDDLKYGTLPAFSFIEPKWVAFAGSTSYHPGNDLIPGERTLNDIFNAIQDSPYWDKTLFVITFDEHGGIADHVPPPYAVPPFVNEEIGGFKFDILGPRIPAIMVSPWITEKTVFRSETEHAYDLTSILSTLLQWFGVPRHRWGMGERTRNAPSFEAIVREKKPRTDKVRLDTPWDSLFPKESESTPPTSGHDLPVHDLHRLVVPRMVADLTPGLNHRERTKISNEILDSSQNLGDLHKHLDELHRRGGRG